MRGVHQTVGFRQSSRGPQVLEVAHHLALATQMDPDARNVVQPLLHFFPGGTGVTVSRLRLVHLNELVRRRSKLIDRRHVQYLFANPPGSATVKKLCFTTLDSNLEPNSSTTSNPCPEKGKSVADSVLYKQTHCARCVVPIHRQVHKKNLCTNQYNGKVARDAEQLRGPCNPCRSTPILSCKDLHVSWGV